MMTNTTRHAGLGLGQGLGLGLGLGLRLRHVARAAVSLAALSFAPAFLTPAALAQTPPPDYGFEWRTIGAPGNPHASPDEFEFLAPRGPGPIGGVNYEFRMMRTELTVSRFIEFATEYSRLRPEVNNDPGLWGSHLIPPMDGYGWRYFDGAADAPADMAWLYAARYANWLHNNKVNELWAFETGAYDMSTFVRGSDGIWTGQAAHLPGARYWLPSLDEWTKGMHYDPNKFGPGQGGYWLYPHTGDEMPVGGFPGTPGAQTGAGEYPGGEGYRVFPVGSYPDTQSPWGLLDGSGGVREWNETRSESFGALPMRGSHMNNRHHFLDDRLDWVSYSWPNVANAGIRLASVVPAPGSLLVLVMCAVGVRHTRKRVS